MPIVDLQRRILEVGRIRIGQQVQSGNKTRPSKLDTFRLTSPSRKLIIQAAEIYGGTPQLWKAPAGSQWEVITTTNTLSVIVPPAELSFSQWYELWSAGGCKRRCDGNTETISDGPCLCDPDRRECSIHTRLSVILADIKSPGLWRLESSGYYSAVELNGSVYIISMAAARGDMLPAELRLDQREAKRDGQVRRYPVPVLEVEIEPAQLIGRPSLQIAPKESAGDPPPASTDDPAPFTPVPESIPEHPVQSIAEQAAAPITSKRRGPDIPRTGMRPRTALETRQAPHTTPEQSPADNPPADVVDVVEAITEPSEEPDPNQTSINFTLDDDPPITTPQLKKLSILRQQAGYPDNDDGRADWFQWVQAHIGREVGSNKQLSKAEASVLIDVLENG